MSITGRRLLLCAAATASVVCAVIHFAVAGEHFSEYWAFGVFMLVAGWLQLGWAVTLMVRPSRTVLALGVLLNAGVIGVYVVTRTVGTVVGPTPLETEPAGFGDLFCTVSEATAVTAAVLLLLRRLDGPLDGRLPRIAAAALSGAGGVLAAVLLSVSLVDGGPEMTMSMDSDAAASSVPVSLRTNSPAGAVTMPESDMHMPRGMQMVNASCTRTPTLAQGSATVRLVNRTWAEAKKYRSLAAAKAAGYRPLTPSGRKVVHYINPAYYRATVQGHPAVDPSAPQSLVYANTPTGAVLAAVMYIDASHAAIPDVGGCLTQWHEHTNLCFARGSDSVVGVTDPTCPAGSVNRVSPPMLHIWLVPVHGGPTAVDAPNRQVVRAAGRVSGPHNPTA